MSRVVSCHPKSLEEACCSSLILKSLVYLMQLEVTKAIGIKGISQVIKAFKEQVRGNAIFWRITLAINKGEGSITLERPSTCQTNLLIQERVR